MWKDTRTERLWASSKDGDVLTRVPPAGGVTVTCAPISPQGSGRDLIKVHDVIETVFAEDGAWEWTSLSQPCKDTTVTWK